MRRVAFYGIVALVPLGIAWIGCGFPGVEFAPTDSEAGSDGATTPDVANGAQDGGNSEEGGIDDAGTRSDAEQRVDANTCANPCDCDGDGYIPKHCDAGAVFDCDDSDPLINPDAGAGFQDGFVPYPWPSDSDWRTAGDWNCDGTVDKRWNVKLKCGCTGEGYTDDPPCGTADVYYECSGTILCSAGSIDNGRVQECR